MLTVLENLPGEAGMERFFKCLLHKAGFFLLQCRRPGFDPWLGKIPWRREWQPIPVILPGKSHGQRSLAGYSPRGHKELDTSD